MFFSRYSTNLYRIYKLTLFKNDVSNTLQRRYSGSKHKWCVNRHTRVRCLSAGQALDPVKDTTVTQRRKDSNIVRLMKEHKRYTSEEWEEMKRNSLASEIVTEQGFGGYVMRLALLENNFESAASYLDHLEKNNEEITIGTLSCFLRVCLNFFEKSGEELLLRVYDRLRAKTDLNVESHINAISGLSKTSRWRDGFDLLRSLETVMKRPTNHPYNALAVCAFKNKDFESGWIILERMLTENRIPSALVFQEMIQAFAKESLNFQQIDRLIEYWRIARLSLPLAVLDNLKDVLENKNLPGKFEGNYVSIKPKGLCRNCETNLEMIELTEDDFNEMSKVILEKIQEGDDKYFKRNQQEMDSLTALVLQTKPFDYVIDTMDIPQVGLLNLVTQLVEVEKKNVLVVGKKRMMSWPIELLEPLTRMAHTLFTDNLSNNELFILYAALRSGNNAFVVSRDVMKIMLNYRYYLHDSVKLQSLFRDWYCCHRHGTQIVGLSRVDLMPTLSYRWLTQKTEHSIHVPCTENFVVEPSFITFAHTKWLCLTKTKCELS